MTRKINVWLNADGGNDIYREIDVSDNATEEEIEAEAKEAAFDFVSWGWYEQEEE